MDNSKHELLKAKVNRFYLNLERCGNVVASAGDPKYANAEGFLNETATDLIRAGIVFFHAAFEDFLREIYRAFWMDQPPEAWDAIPFIGGQGDDRRTKFSIKELAAFRGMTVDVLIAKWFDSWLDRETYNNFGDVVQLLERMGVAKQPFQKYASLIEFVMQRRHRIVHNVDFESPQSTSPADWEDADVHRFTIATIAVQSFAAELVSELIGGHPAFTPLLDGMKKRAMELVDEAGLSPSGQFPFV